MSRCTARNRTGVFAQPRSRRILLGAIAAGLPLAVMGASIVDRSVKSSARVAGTGHRGHFC